MSLLPESSGDARWRPGPARGAPVAASDDEGEGGLDAGRGSKGLDLAELAAELSVDALHPAVGRLTYAGAPRLEVGGGFAKGRGQRLHRFRSASPIAVDKGTQSRGSGGPAGGMGDPPVVRQNRRPQGFGGGIANIAGHMPQTALVAPVGYGPGTASGEGR